MRNKSSSDAEDVQKESQNKGQSVISHYYFQILAYILLRTLMNSLFTF